MQLISGFDMNLATPDCVPNATWYRARINLYDDIAGAFPYLNAELKCADYNNDAKVLLWNNGEKKYAFRPHEIIIAPVHDREEAEKLAYAILQTVNEICDRKDKIEPKFEGRKHLPDVLDIYKVLRRTNCRRCGYLSCIAFATALRSDPSKLLLCPHLSKRDFVENGQWLCSENKSRKQIEY